MPDQLIWFCLEKALISQEVISYTGFISTDLLEVVHCSVLRYRFIVPSPKLQVLEDNVHMSICMHHVHVEWLNGWFPVTCVVT